MLRKLFSRDRSKERFNNNKYNPNESAESMIKMQPVQTSIVNTEEDHNSFVLGEIDLTN